MSAQDDFFGEPHRVALARRSAHLWRLLGDNPRYSYYGRLVALAEPGSDAADILSALARLQGAAVSYYYPAAHAADLYAELEARGLKTDRHELFRGSDNAFAASAEIERDQTLPADLSVRIMDAETPHELLADAADLCLSCDVMPVPAPVMRGQVRKGVCLAAIDAGDAWSPPPPRT